MVCKRGHGKWFMTKRVGRKTKVCEFILAFRQEEGTGSNVVFCGDLRKNKTIPVGYLKLTT